MSDVKAQLAALAARQSGGKTNDPAALTGPSSINAKVPAIPDPEGAKKGKSAAGKAGGKGKAKASTKQKMRQEKARERAEALGGLMEKKLKEKEGRKVSSSAAERGEARSFNGRVAGELRESEARSVFAPQATNPENTFEAAVGRTRFIAFTERESAKPSVVLSMIACFLRPSTASAVGVFVHGFSSVSEVTMRGGNADKRKWKALCIPGTSTKRLHPHGFRMRARLGQYRETIAYDTAYFARISSIRGKAPTAREWATFSSAQSFPRILPDAACYLSSFPHT